MSRRQTLVLVTALVSVSCVGLAGCDTATEHVTVENQCGETLKIVAAEAPEPNAHGYTHTGADAGRYGEFVAAGESKKYALMDGAGGFIVEALAPDGSAYGAWHNLDDPERSFILSKDTGTCPR